MQGLAIRESLLPQPLHLGPFMYLSAPCPSPRSWFLGLLQTHPLSPPGPPSCAGHSVKCGVCQRCSLEPPTLHDPGIACLQTVTAGLQLAYLRGSRILANSRVLQSHTTSIDCGSCSKFRMSLVWYRSICHMLPVSGKSVTTSTSRTWEH